MLQSQSSLLAQRYGPRSHGRPNDDSTRRVDSVEIKPNNHTQASPFTICLIEPHPLLQPILLTTLDNIPNSTTSVTPLFVNDMAVCPNLFVLDRSILGYRFDTQVTQISIQCPFSRLAVLDEALTDSEQCLLIARGIHGYLPYSNFDTGISELVSALMNNRLWFASTVLERYISRQSKISTTNRHCILTVRQEQIASLIRQGYSNKEISSTLNISESTVKFHLSKMFERLGVRTRRSLFALAEMPRIATSAEVGTVYRRK